MFLLTHPDTDEIFPLLKTNLSLGCLNGDRFGLLGVNTDGGGAETRHTWKSKYQEMVLGF